MVFPHREKTIMTVPPVPTFSRSRKGWASLRATRMGAFQAEQPKATRS